LSLDFDYDLFEFLEQLRAELAKMETNKEVFMSVYLDLPLSVNAIAGKESNVERIYH
jgi:hypothetical protein